MVKDLNDPTNVDSIPAILTPGEYVLNKEAATMFGPIIEQMNHAGLQQRHAENQQVLQMNTGGLVDIIKKEEGFRDKAYQDPGGVWTIGYGRTTNPDGSPIKPGQVTSREAEDNWIVGRVDQERKAVEAYGNKHGYNWGPNQIDALASFRYNGGQGMLEQLTAGGKRDDAVIANKMLEYNKQRIDGKLTPLAGLTKRRQMEASLFTGGQAPETQPQQPQQQVAQAPTGPLQFAKAAQQKQSNPLAGLGSALVQGAVAGALSGGAPVQHQASRQYTQLAAAPLLSEDKMKRVQTFNNGGGAWWNPFSWFDDDEQQIKQVQQQIPEPGTDEALLQFGSQQQQQIAGLPVGHPERVAAIESGKFIPTEGDLQWDEQRWRTNEALHRQQLQSAVTAPDAPGAQFTQDRVNALTAQLDSLGVPPQDQGVGTQINVGGPDASVLTGDVPPLGSAPNELGAVPGLDINAPLPQDVIDNQPQDLFTDPTILPAPGEEETAYNQAVATDAPVSLPHSAPELRAAAEEKGLLHIDKKAPAIKEVSNSLEEADTEAVEPTDTIVQNAGGVDVIENSGKEQSKDPNAMKGAMGAIKEAFGELFNPKELARAAIMYLGARATGMSGGQALGFAGKTYLGRLDAKQGAYEKAALSGDYTKESLKTYKETGDPIDLIPKGVAPVELGNSKEFYSSDGRRIQAREVKVGENKIWVDKNNQPVNLNTVHQDASRAPGTQEYRTRIQTESKQYSDVFKELQDRFGKFETRSGDAYTTDLTPGKVGLDAAKWATKNDVPPDAMGQLIDNAYAAARADSTDGKRVKGIEAYLNDQYIQSQVGDPTLFKGASGEKVNMLMGVIASKAQALPQFQGMSRTAISSTVMQIYRPKWGNLSEEERKSYNRRAGPGMSGFMVYLKDQL